MSGISEPIYDFRREIEAVVERHADRTVSRIEDILLICLKHLWDENEPFLDEADTEEGWHNYGAAQGARAVVAQIAKDFDLFDDLRKHDEAAEGYA